MKQWHRAMRQPPPSRKSDALAAAHCCSVVCDQACRAPFAQTIALLQNGGELPTVYKQKKEVRAILESYRRTEMQAFRHSDHA